MATPATKFPNPKPNGDWTVVLPRRRIRRSCKHYSKDSNCDSNSLQTLEIIPWTPSDPHIDRGRVSNLLQKMLSSTTNLESSKFYRRFLSQFRDSKIQDNLSNVLSSTGPELQIVVYGIGSIETYEPPRLQLSLILLLKRELGQASTRSVEVFDPVLSSEECVVLEALGCRVLSVDERGRREVERPTIFYMPHCEALLYDGLIEANWRSSALNQMVVLGNSFEEYERYVRGFSGGGSVAANVKHVLRVREFVEEVGLEKVILEGEEEVFFRAFNETSWHFFNLNTDTDRIDPLKKVS